MDVAPRQREARARGETRRRTIVPPQNNFRGERVIGEAPNGSDFFAGEPAQGLARTEMMRRDVDR